MRRSSREEPEPPGIGEIVKRPAWVLLVLLLALAVNSAAAFLPVAPDLRTGFHLLVAALTIGFIAFVFMELGQKGPLFRLFAAAGFVWIGILFLLSFSDYGMRP